MDILRDLVRNLAVIVVLASFLELLLPIGSMRGFVRLVMGLFMILTVLNPLLHFIKADFIFPTFTTPALSSQTGEALAKGEVLAKQNRDLALEEYKKRLAQQIKAVAEMKGNLLAENVTVTLVGEDTSQPTGEIKKIALAVKPGHQENSSGASWVAPVAPVNISGAKKLKPGAKEQKESLEPRAKNQLAATLANFYNLSPSQVKILTP